MGSSVSTVSSYFSLNHTQDTWQLAWTIRMGQTKRGSYLLSFTWNRLSRSATQGSFDELHDELFPVSGLQKCCFFCLNYFVFILLRTNSYSFFRFQCKCHFLSHPHWSSHYYSHSKASFSFIKIITTCNYMLLICLLIVYLLFNSPT